MLPWQPPAISANASLPPMAEATPIGAMVSKFVFGLKPYPLLFQRMGAAS
jgi:hypothetical protein